MILKNMMEIFDELHTAEISFKSKHPIKEYSMLDLEDTDVNFLFNSSNSLANYRQRVIGLHQKFKVELDRLKSESASMQGDIVRIIKSRITELNILLNPKNEEIQYARINLPRYSQKTDNTGNLDCLKKKPATS